MKSRKNRNYSFVAVLLLTALSIILSAVTFAVAAHTVPEKLTMQTDYTFENTHAELWPWSILNESDSSPALGLIDDPELMSKDSLNTLARNLLISASHSTIPHSVISSTDFSDKIMITEDDFHIWIRDYVITASNNEELITGFYGFAGEYKVVHSAYCIRYSALSEDNIWTDCTKDDIIAYFTGSGESVIYSDAPTASEREEDENGMAEEYIRIDGEIYVMESSLIERTMGYIQSVMTLSGFESVTEEFLPGFADAITNGTVKAYKNGDLLVISFYDTIPFKLHLFYDLGTETFCGWARE